MKRKDPIHLTFKIILTSLRNFRFLFMLIGVSLPLFGENPANDLERVAVCLSAEVKKDYLLTEEDFKKHSSYISNIDKIKLPVSKIINNARNHINTTQFKAIAPSLYEALKKKNNGKPQSISIFNDDRHIKLIRMELQVKGQYAYWKLVFSIVGRSNDIHVTTVVCYLNGEFAKIVKAKGGSTP